ncbi:MAG: polysaccharide biosynthesis C-terminal domain-containing protein [Lachnospiraceae bacterium]|nr:polysaccharide biosynthesis C-terminal domain-containing protein [Lachnospiraceae bacterium]
MLRTPVEIWDIAHIYLKILYAGIPITFFFNLHAAILRAFGDSKKPLYAMLIASLGNIVLDLVFVVNLKMGIAGAA